MPQLLKNATFFIWMQYLQQLLLRSLHLPMYEKNKELTLRVWRNTFSSCLATRWSAAASLMCLEHSGRQRSPERPGCTRTPDQTCCLELWAVIMDSGSDLRKLNLSVNLLYRCDCLLQEGWRSRREETVERGERRREPWLRSWSGEELWTHRVGSSVFIRWLQRKREKRFQNWWQHFLSSEIIYAIYDEDIDSPILIT